MDILAHALYGATLCSETGLAGGRSGSTAPRWFRDRTLWWSLVFGVLPDGVSMWIPFTAYTIAGVERNYFLHYGGGWLTVYRAVHNLIVPLTVSAILFVLRRRLFVPSLAWTIHVVMDAVSHGAGKYQTLLFYPFSSWGIEGISWWRAPWFFAGYWLVLLAIWILIAVWRRTEDD